MTKAKLLIAPVPRMLPQGPWISRQALHAASLTLTHPSRPGLLTVTAPPPPDFVAAAAAVGLVCEEDVWSSALTDTAGPDTTRGGLAGFR